ncbi:hypothetical protein BLOT_004555 [Blomia tropicalis]|nr:hypothetical protein BLOT_004555 [Blomia tropicalis]
MASRMEDGAILNDSHSLGFLLLCFAFDNNQQFQQVDYGQIGGCSLSHFRPFDASPIDASID